MSKVDWSLAPEGAEFFANRDFRRSNGTICPSRFDGGLWRSGAFTTEECMKAEDYELRPKNWPSEQRIDIIGTNGNGGMEQSAPERTTSDEIAKPVYKYHRTVKGIQIDVYDVLVAYGVTCPALAHGIKKAILPGQRHAKTFEQDIDEAIASLQRAKELAAGTTTN
jgi:hypothetical protein